MATLESTTEAASFVTYRPCRSIAFRRWTRATRCLTRILQYTEADAQCNKLVKVVRRMSTIASIVNLLRLTTVATEPLSNYDETLLL